MPPLAYLPDPQKWITPGSTASVPRSIPKQRPLAIVKNDYPTPPTSTSRHRSSSRPTNENKPSAGPSRLRDGSLIRGGLSGWLTPPTTASQPRLQVDRLRHAQADSSAGRGSPVSRSTATLSGKSARRPLGSRLAVKEDWKSEEEEEDEIQVYDEEPTRRAGPSSTRPASSKRSSAPPRQSSIPTPKIPESRKLKFAFSSGELSDLPPRYGDDDTETERDDNDDDIVCLPAPTASAEAATIPSRPTITTNTNPYAHLDISKSPRLDQLEDSQPNLTPRVLTQLPTQALAMHWRVNGHSTDQIKKGEEPWGKSAGRIENAARLKEMEKDKAKERQRLELIEQAEGLEQTAEKAKQVVDEMLDDVGLKAKEMRTSILREDSIDRKEGAGRARIEDSRVPTRQPLTLRGLNAENLPSRNPSPKVSKRRTAERGVGRHASTIRSNTPPGVSLEQPRRAVTPTPRIPSRTRSITASPPHSDELDEVLDPIVEEAKRDAFERHEKLRLRRLIPSAANVTTIVSPNPSPDPLTIANPDHSHHHIVTPPKKKRRVHHDADQRDFSPPLRPSSSSPHRDCHAGPSNFKPVEIDETLMTWSPAVSGAEGAAGGFPLGREAEAAVEQDTAVRREEEVVLVSSPPEPRHMEETQSIPNTEYTQSYPRYFASQTVPVPKRPTAPAQVTTSSRPSKWQSLQDSGILRSTPNPATGTPPTATSGSGGKRKRPSGQATISSGKQSKLEMFGIAKDLPVRKAKDFDNAFEDEQEIEEEEAIAGETSREGARAGLQAVPEAPFHPELRPAGVRAAKARAERQRAASSTSRPQTRARTRDSDRSSPLVLVTGPSRAQQSSSPMPTGTNPCSSSLLTDSTEGQTPEFLRSWYGDTSRDRRGG